MCYERTQKIIPTSGEKSLGVGLTGSLTWRNRWNRQGEKQRPRLHAGRVGGQEGAVSRQAL